MPKISQLSINNSPLLGNEIALINKNGVTQVTSISSIGSGGSNVSTLSGNWQNTYTIMQANSAEFFTNTENTVSALLSATDEEIQSILPNVLEVDYIELADQSSNTIQDNRLGQKGGVLYFGNSPVTDFGAQVKNFSAGIDTSIWWNFPLATFTIPAGLTGDTSKFCRFDIDATFIYGSPLSGVSVNNLDICLCLVTQSEYALLSSNNLRPTGSLIIDLGGSFVGFTGNIVSLRGSLLMSYNNLFTFNPLFALSDNIIKFSSQSSSFPGHVGGMTNNESYFIGADATGSVGLSAVDQQEVIRLMLIPTDAYNPDPNSNRYIDIFSVIATGTAKFYPDYQPNT